MHFLSICGGVVHGAKIGFFWNGRFLLKLTRFVIIINMPLKGRRGAEVLFAAKEL